MQHHHPARGHSFFPFFCRRSLAFLCIISLLLAQCWVLPAHAAYWGSIGMKDEKEMGRQFAVMVRAKLPLIDDPEVKLYVQGVVDTLAKTMPPQPFPFVAGVILHNTMNAFAVPGGQVFIFSGLMMQLDSEAELAGVMAHEMAHVTQRHMASRMEKAQAVTMGSLLLAVAGLALGGGGAAAVGAMGAGQSAMLNYSRIDETEADSQGYQYLLKAKYPPQAMAQGFQKIRQKSWIGGGGSLPAYLSTHPDLGERISNIMARVQAAPASVRNRPVDNRRFMRVQTLLWGRYGDEATALHRFDAEKNNIALAQMGKGLVYTRMNNVPDALQAFNSALHLQPNDSLILREAGIFHYKLGDKHLADQYLRAAMQADRQDYMARYYYARLLDETGRTREALPYYQEVLRYVPEDSEVHAAYARSLGQNGQTFLAHLHLAYSALYINDKKKTARLLEKAKGIQRSASDTQALRKFETIYKERKEIWEES
ncbi:MAG: M48 family metalloprotease [Desulfovibrionaceae bacterium]|nr:M48 family metalloprotease [Desulfovibrionaceae bacterium]